jgi:hypothetical protein
MTVLFLLAQARPGCTRPILMEVGSQAHKVHDEHLRPMEWALVREPPCEQKVHDQSDPANSPRPILSQPTTAAPCHHRATLVSFCRQASSSACHYESAFK